MNVWEFEEKERVVRFCEHYLFYLISTCYDRHIEHIKPTAFYLMRVKQVLYFYQKGDRVISNIYNLCL